MPPVERGTLTDDPAPEAAEDEIETGPEVLADTAGDGMLGTEELASPVLPVPTINV